jgi:hypothetical protein
VCRAARFFLAMCILIQISMTPSDISDGLVAVSKCRSAISLCSYEIYGYV